MLRVYRIPLPCEEQYCLAMYGEHDRFQSVVATSSLACVAFLLLKIFYISMKQVGCVSVSVTCYWCHALFSCLAYLDESRGHFANVYNGPHIIHSPIYQQGVSAKPCVYQHCKCRAGQLARSRPWEFTQSRAAACPSCILTGILTGVLSVG